MGLSFAFVSRIFPLNSLIADRKTCKPIIESFERILINSSHACEKGMLHLSIGRRENGMRFGQRIYML